jgi:hypothetical protein
MLRVDGAPSRCSAAAEFGIDSLLLGIAAELIIAA